MVAQCNMGEPYVSSAVAELHHHQGRDLMRFSTGSNASEPIELLQCHKWRYGPPVDSRVAKKIERFFGVYLRTDLSPQEADKSSPRSQLRLNRDMIDRTTYRTPGTFLV